MRTIEGLNDSDSVTSGTERNFASGSVARHLLRGAIGFGLVIGSIALVPAAGLVTLLLAPLGLVALRGCPTCWMIGLAQTISRGRLSAGAWTASAPWRRRGAEGCHNASPEPGRRTGCE